MMARLTHSTMYEPSVPVGVFRRTLRSVTGFLLPQACVNCRREGELLCYECFAGLERVEGARCASCGELVGAGTDGLCRLRDRSSAAGPTRVCLPLSRCSP